MQTDLAERRAGGGEKTQDDRDRFVAMVVDALRARESFRLVLADNRGPDRELVRMEGRPVEIRGGTMLALVSRYRTRDTTSNLTADQAGTRLRELLAGDFRKVHLIRDDGDTQLSISKRGKALLRSSGAPRIPEGGDEDGEGEAITNVAAKPGEADPARSHNRAKPRPIALDRPFLRALGITDHAGRLVPAMARKWKQINRFIEVFDGAWRSSGLADRKEPLRLADFGAGKGYLTFALHDWLRNAMQVDARMIGVEIRQDLVAAGNRVVSDLGIEGLEFRQGDIGSHGADDPSRGIAAPAALDVLIALHACDTATDEAMHLGVRAGASIIMCAPCCHKQVRPQLLSPHPLRPILRHGIHLGQEAEMVTDGLRALLLEASGYDTQVFEFISLEHTSKNKMILAVKRRVPRDSAPLLAQVRELKAFYGIREQRLESLLQADGRSEPGS
jgi:hypothetical protein